MNNDMRHKIFSLLILSFVFAAQSFAHLETKIVSIKGIYSTIHEQTLEVYPEDVISLSADQLDNGISLNREEEDFLWSTDFSSADACDPEYSCVGTQFEPHAYGANYYVPRQMDRAITITVRNKQDGTYDQLTLINKSYALQGGYTPPRTAYSDPADYSHASLDFNVALTGHGSWVYIGTNRVFVPQHYMADWQPYQHGYWYWTSYGWTWYSYDPWGWVTDHYGYWRHHQIYGWVWAPFQTVRYYPSVARFFFTSEGVGWSPYWSEVVYTRDYGYNDGFWDGYQAGLHAHYRFGWTFVLSHHFLSPNIYHHHHRHLDTIIRHYHTAHSNHHYGHVDRIFMERRVRRPIQETRVTVISRPTHYGSEVHIVRPVTSVARPDIYRNATIQSSNRVATRGHVSVGAVVNPQTGRVTHTPRSLGRDVVVVPRHSDGREVAPRSRINRRPVERPDVIRQQPRQDQPTRQAPIVRQPQDPTHRNDSDSRPNLSPSHPVHSPANPTRRDPNVKEPQQPIRDREPQHRQPDRRDRRPLPPQPIYRDRHPQDGRNKPQQGGGIIRRTPKQDHNRGGGGKLPRRGGGVFHPR